MVYCSEFQLYNLGPALHIDVSEYLNNLRQHGFILPKDSVQYSPDNESEIKRGNFAAVRKATNRETGEIWAVKRLETHAENGSWARAIALQEAWAMLQVKGHPNVVELKAVLMDGDDDQLPYLAMEFMERGCLRDHLLELQRRDALTRSEEQHLEKVVQQIATAELHVIQCGFVHRDLAPRNVLLDKHGNAKLGDFGHCRALNRKGYYRSKDFRLDLPVRSAAPELIVPDPKYSSSTEVHALGVCVHEIWSLGREPFAFLDNGDVVRLLQSKSVQLNTPKHCPPVWMQFLLRCWEVNPRKRMTMVEALEHIASIVLTGQLQRNTSVKQAKAKKRFLAVVLAAFLSIVAVTVLAVIFSQKHGGFGSTGCKSFENATFTDVVLFVGGIASDGAALTVFSAEAEKILYYLDETVISGNHEAVPKLQYHATAQLNDHEILIIGGLLNESYAIANVFAIDTLTWRKRDMQAMAVERTFGAVVSDDRYILVCGGVNASQNVATDFYDSCELFDVESESWQLGHSMHRKRGGHAMVLVELNNTVYAYAIGGKWCSPCFTQNDFVHEIERMEFPFGKWELVDSAFMARGNDAFAAATLGTDVWACGGRWADYCRVLHAAAGQWSNDTQIVGDTHANGLSMYSYRDSVYLVGGQFDWQKKVSKYNTTNETWSSWTAFEHGIQFASTVFSSEIRMQVCVENW